MEAITASTGIKRTQLIDDESRLPDNVIQKLWRMLGALPLDQSPALHMASATPPTMFGPCEHLVRYAPSLEEAMNAVVRFGKVLADRVEIELALTESTASIQFWHPLDQTDGGNAGEVGLAMLFRLIEECQQESHLIGVDFAHQPLGPVSGYERFFGVPISFGQPRNTLHYRREALRNPMQQADPLLFRYVQANVELIEDRWMIPGERSLISNIYSAAQMNAELGKFSAEELAITLRINLRKLQRETKSHGLTVTGILDEAREAMAKRLLDNPRNSIERIADELDYSDGRAFRRAFTRWTGMTPSAYRNEETGT
ncbi:MAG: AraC family transcriptional regulator ligand-binding domain-containing protein [Planctomycetota bacterium]